MRQAFSFFLERRMKPVGKVGIAFHPTLPKGYPFVAASDDCFRQLTAAATAATSQSHTEICSVLPTINLYACPRGIFRFPLVAGFTEFLGRVSLFVFSKPARSLCFIGKICCLPAF
jgi:hypothetical protein